MSLFPLEKSIMKSFHVTGKVAITLREDQSLQVNSGFFDRLWVGEKLPPDFRVSLRFKVEDPDGKFIVGIGNGETWKPDYHFVMNPIWTAFKKYLDAPDHWDRYLHMTRDDPYVVKPNVTFHVVFERRNRVATITLNGKQVFVVDDEQEDLNNYNYLFVAGTMVLEALEFEPLS